MAIQGKTNSLPEELLPVVMFIGDVELESSCSFKSEISLALLLRIAITLSYEEIHLRSLHVLHDEKHLSVSNTLLEISCHESLVSRSGVVNSLICESSRSATR